MTIGIGLRRQSGNRIYRFPVLEVQLLPTEIVVSPNPKFCRRLEALLAGPYPENTRLPPNPENNGLPLSPENMWPAAPILENTGQPPHLQRNAQSPHPAKPIR